MAFIASSLDRSKARLVVCTDTNSMYCFIDQGSDGMLGAIVTIARRAIANTYLFDFDFAFAFPRGFVICLVSSSLCFESECK